MKRISEHFDLIVVGGGLAGTCAAIAAARGGLKTCLIHERPVLGGVASSEMRVTVHGAGCHHAYARESGIIGELLTEERARNHEAINENGWTNSVFDQVLYDACVRESNLTLHLNTPVHEVIMKEGKSVEQAPHTERGYYYRPACHTSRKIHAVVARTQSAEVEMTLSADHFVDCTGDALVADRAGCEWRMGTESKAEFGEAHAPETASTETMGNSIHIRAKDVGRPAPFTPPEWAVKHEDPGYFYKQGRIPHDPRGGYWWIEIGIPWNTIYDNETIRHELTRHALGIWDWMKNHDPKMKDVCKNYALDFIGQVPGKRESRRVVGRHWITENELARREDYPDVVAHGGWFLDLHTAGGLLAPTSEPAAAEGYKQDSEYAAKSYIGPYGVPLRSLMAKDMDNLFMAGRCLSTSRAAMGTLRVMGTTALMGQAVGTAAALMKRHQADFLTLAEDAKQGGPLMQAIQQQLMADGVFITNRRHQAGNDLSLSATVTASSSALFHGQSPNDRDYSNGQRDWFVRPPVSLNKVQGQLLFLKGGQLDSLSVFLDNSGEESTVQARLVRLELIWDYRKGGSETLAETTLKVSTGDGSWIDWPCALTGLAEGSYRLELQSDSETVRWHKVTHFQPGHVCYAHLSPTLMRDQHVGLAIRVKPGQPCYGPEQIQTGICRPQASTNCWRSDAGVGMPQWLQLEWSQPQTIRRLNISFAGHLLMEVHPEPGFWRDPQTARDYDIQARVGDSWETVHRVRGNYQRQNKLTLETAVTCRQLRLLVLATNGDPTVTVYEFRAES